METTIEYEVSAPNAMFANPATKTGGELNSYPIPTYSALVGITESIYWKPSIKWVVDAVRVMKPIHTEVRALLFPELHARSGGDRAYGSYLRDVCYQVRAHFIFNPGVEPEFQPKKHMDIALRSLDRGGRRPIYLGKRDGCDLGRVHPTVFGSGTGAYDGDGKLDLGTMFHSYLYPTAEQPSMRVLLWQPVMDGGVIQFIPPDQCTLIRKIRDMSPQRITYTAGVNLTPTEKEAEAC